MRFETKLHTRGGGVMYFSSGNFRTRLTYTAAPMPTRPSLHGTHHTLLDLQGTRTAVRTIHQKTDQKYLVEPRQLGISKRNRNRDLDLRF
jgi:hypothetical protein